MKFILSFFVFTIVWKRFLALEEEGSTITEGEFLNESWSTSSTTESFVFSITATAELVSKKDGNLVDPNNSLQVELLAEKMNLRVMPFAQSINFSLELLDSKGFASDGTLYIGFKNENNKFTDLVILSGTMTMNSSSFSFLREIQVSQTGAL